MKNKSKGFTLIELLVVVAIISLLSSVILAAIKDARDRASDNAVRQSIGQFVTALELYKVNYGTYLTSSLISYFDNPTGESQIFGSFPTELSQYISEFPKSTKRMVTIQYHVGTSVDKCQGDVVAPPYIITVDQGASTIFDDWELTIRSGVVQNSRIKCFSLK